MTFDVAARLTELREKSGLTTNRLANNAGISQSHLREIELGKKNPTVETLSLICCELGVDLAEFFSPEESEITPALLSSVKKLSPEQQNRLAQFLCSLGE